MSHAQHLLDSVVAIAAAYLLVLPLGWERRARSAAHVGLRTLPLVAVGTCAYLLLARYLREAGVFDADGLARSLRAMMTGIGFIGGGAILEVARHVRGVGGVATAASVWTTGAIGASVAVGHYTVALVLALVTLLVLEVPRGRDGSWDGSPHAPARPSGAKRSPASLAGDRAGVSGKDGCGGPQLQASETLPALPFSLQVA